MRDEALLMEWQGTPIGTRVTVHRANGETIKTITLCEPFSLAAGAYVRVHGIAGNTHLRRVDRGWNDYADSKKRRPSIRELQRRLVAWRDAEIRRLRAAMAHAMDDCEAAIRAGVRSRASTYVFAAHAALKTALEEK